VPESITDRKALHRLAEDSGVVGGRRGADKLGEECVRQRQQCPGTMQREGD
jgi:hypothetical protein